MDVERMDYPEFITRAASRIPVSRTPDNKNPNCVMQVSFPRQRWIDSCAENH